MHIFAGCDGGGTKCEVHVSAYDEFGQLTHSGRATGGPANVRSTPETTSNNIVQTTLDALSNAGLPANSKFDSYVAALAGAGTVEIQNAWALRLSQYLYVSRIQIFADAAILFAAADVESAAVATVIGTGSIVWARSSSGSLKRAGGLGPYEGDEGSAFWIGKEATLALARGDLSRKLAEALLQQDALKWFPSRDLDKVSKPTSVFPEPMSQVDLAGLAPIVFEFANDDPCARDILNRGVEHLAVQIRTATAEETSTTNQQLSWVCTGGVAQNQTEYLNSIRNAASGLGTKLMQPTIVDCPVVGALKLAAKLDTNS